MLLGEVFERFAAQSPVSVMTRAAFEHALSADAVDALFEEHAEHQYTRALVPQLASNISSGGKALWFV